MTRIEKILVEKQNFQPGRGRTKQDRIDMFLRDMRRKNREDNAPVWIVDLGYYAYCFAGSFLQAKFHALRAGAIFLVDENTNIIVWEK